jgi:hypothetical protein
LKITIFVNIKGNIFSVGASGGKSHLLSPHLKPHHFLGSYEKNLQTYKEQSFKSTVETHRGRLSQQAIKCKNSIDEKKGL